MRSDGEKRVAVYGVTPCRRLKFIVWTSGASEMPRTSAGKVAAESAEGFVRGCQGGPEETAICLRGRFVKFDKMPGLARSAVALDRSTHLSAMHLRLTIDVPRR